MADLSDLLLRLDALEAKRRHLEVQIEDVEKKIRRLKREQSAQAAYYAKLNDWFKSASEDERAFHWLLRLSGVGKSTAERLTRNGGASRLWEITQKGGSYPPRTPTIVAYQLMDAAEKFTNPPWCRPWW